MRFNLYDESVGIESDDGTIQFEATLTLNDEGECRFLVKGEELDCWQVLRRALEPVFFSSAAR